MRNLHSRFDWHYIGQIYGRDFAKFCGLLGIYELYYEVVSTQTSSKGISNPKREMGLLLFIFPKSAVLALPKSAGYLFILKTDDC